LFETPGPKRNRAKTTRLVLDPLILRQEPRLVLERIRFWPSRSKPESCSCRMKRMKRSRLTLLHLAPLISLVEKAPLPRVDRSDEEWGMVVAFVAAKKDPQRGAPRQLCSNGA